MLIKYFIVSMCQIFVLVQLVHKNYSARHLPHNMLSLLFGPSMAHYTRKMSKGVFNGTKTPEFKNMKFVSLVIFTLL